MNVLRLDHFDREPSAHDSYECLNMWARSCQKGGAPILVPCILRRSRQLCWVSFDSRNAKMLLEHGNLECHTKRYIGAICIYKSANTDLQIPSFNVRIDATEARRVGIPQIMTVDSAVHQDTPHTVSRFGDDNFPVSGSGCRRRGSRAVGCADGLLPLGRRGLAHCAWGCSSC